MTHKNETQSPDLEVISNANLKREERRHLPRLSLTSEQFRLSDHGKIFSVSDLSVKGIGFWILDREDLQFFQIGSLVKGDLNLKREKHPVSVRVRNINRDRVGCEFESISTESSRAISLFLDPSTLGAELKPIPSNELATLWYHGPSGTDLLFKRTIDNQIEKMTLYVSDCYVQWDGEEGLTTGHAKLSGEESEVRGILRLESLLLDADVQPDSTKLRIAKTVIVSSNLPQDLKNWCVRQLGSGER